MTKAELIEGLASKLNLNKAEAEKAINLLLDDIVAALKQAERVNISGFGTFSVSERAPKPDILTRSPCLSAATISSSRRLIAFSASALFRLSLLASPSISSALV